MQYEHLIIFREYLPIFAHTILHSRNFNFSFTRIDGGIDVTSLSVLRVRPLGRTASCAATLGAAARDGWRRRGAALARALSSRRPGHRSSPAATLAGCRCPAWRALREVPKCLRASYTRATIDRAPSSSSIFEDPSLPIALISPSCYIPRSLASRSTRSTSFTASFPDFYKRKKSTKRDKERGRRKKMKSLNAFFFFR